MEERLDQIVLQFTEVIQERDQKIHLLEERVKKLETSIQPKIPGIYRTGNKWYAKYKNRHIGVFNTPEEASQARKQAILKDKFQLSESTHLEYREEPSPP